MKLGALLAQTGAVVAPAARGVEVTSLAVDSRGVQPGALFAALPGVAADGATYAAQAVQRGAAAVLAGRALEVAPAALAVAENPRAAFARAAARFHGDPSRALELFGVTGTNGKTTTAFLVEQLATARGLPAGLIGTVEARWPGGRLEATHTTPESHELQALLGLMVAAGTKICAIEVSSHALAQERVAGCVFAGAAFTNLTRDHLDYHRTMEEYLAAKERLFTEHLPRGAPAVLNLDDERVAALAARLAAGGAKVIGFTLGATQPGAPAAALRAENLASTLAGLSFELVAAAPLAPGRVRVESPLVGAHNAQNLLCALGLLLGAGGELSALADAVRGAAGAPGRLERVPDVGGRIALVDYAHTDDALARVLDAVTAAAAGARVICVFGCGGDRDRGKRPLMGRAAGARAQLAIATSDNPRTEDPAAILAAIEPGLREAGRRPLTPDEARAGGDGYLIVPDRRAAIALAAACARRGDAILIAGKGHEPYQLVGKDKLPFDDRLVARDALAQEGPRP